MNIQTLVITLDYYCYTSEMMPLLESTAALAGCETEKYFKELQSLVTCLSRLPNIVEMTILRPMNCNVDQGMKDYLASLTAWLTTHYNQIQSLTFFTKLIDLGFLSGLPNLQSLHFCGYSCTAAADAAQIFRKMDQLDSLTLTRSQPTEIYLPNSPKVSMSIDGEVLRSMKPLKEVKIIDTTRESKYDADDD